MDKVQKTIGSQYYTPSLEHFRIYPNTVVSCYSCFYSTLSQWDVSHTASNCTDWAIPVPSFTRTCLIKLDTAAWQRVILASSQVPHRPKCFLITYNKTYVINHRAKWEVVLSRKLISYGKYDPFSWLIMLPLATSAGPLCTSPVTEQTYHKALKRPA
jgi:hypothetical protein